MTDLPKFKQVYNTSKSVLDAAKERVSFVFDNFEHVIVSISGGKDSTVLAVLAIEEAKRRGRRVGIFFLDEEVVYEATVKQVEYLMSYCRDAVTPMWYQVSFSLTNAVSREESQLITWDESKRSVWMRKNKKAFAVKEIPWVKERTKTAVGGVDFYGALWSFENMHHNTAFLVGLRADESLNRYRAMIKNPVMVNGHRVFYATARTNGNVTFYPIYDWQFGDVWKFIHDNNIQYSAVYDWQYRLGLGITELRCSSLIHEKSFKSISELPSFEPKTYDRLLRRIKGISFAQETGKDAKSFQCRKLPKEYKSWQEYRDMLLATYPVAEHKVIFERRFRDMPQNEYVARQQCRQLVLADYENNLPINTSDEAMQARLAKIEYYRSVL